MSNVMSSIFMFKATYAQEVMWFSHEVTIMVIVCYTFFVQNYIEKVGV